MKIKAITEELIASYAKRGLIKIKLNNNEGYIYGYIKGKTSSMSNLEIRYEFIELRNYNELNPDNLEEYDRYLRFFDFADVKEIFSLHKISEYEIKLEMFNQLMIRVENYLFGNFIYEITPQKNVLVLRSDFIKNPETAITVINVMLEDQKDWHIFNSMNFDLVVFKGQEMYKLTNEQVWGVFSRRNG